MSYLSLANIRLGQRQGASTPSVPARRRRLMQPAWLRLPCLSIGNVLRTPDTPGASKGASDQELVRLAGPLGHLKVEDVRWDLIGAAHSGRRYRT